MKHATLISSALMIVCNFLAATLTGQDAAQPEGGLQPGDIGLVVRDRAELMQKDEVLLRLQLGSEFTVQEVRDKWIGGLIRLEDQPRTGWVRADDLVPLESAAARFRELLARSPRNYDLLLVNARLLRDQEKLDAAEKLYDRAVAVSPQDKRGFRQRGYLRYLQGNHEQAIADYSQALKLDPDDVLSYTNRALNRQALGQYQEALEDYERAAQLNQRSALAMNNAAWLRATCPDDSLRDGELALKLAQSACELTSYENFDFLDTLAAAHAERGEFEEALKQIALAIKLAPDEFKPELLQRQMLYKQRKPFRDKVLEN